MQFVPGSTLGLHEDESRFLCLKIINDTLVTLLNEESIYVPHYEVSSANSSQNTAGTNQAALASTQKIN